MIARALLAAADAWLWARCARLRRRILREQLDAEIRWLRAVRA